MKLQKFHGPEGRNLEALLDEAWRVFSNLEEGYKQRMRKLMAVVKEEGKEGEDKDHLGKDHPCWAKISVQIAENLDTGKTRALN